MRIKEVCEKTGLTDKAVRTYINNQLINPDYTENYTGRKNYCFREEDIDTLRKIALLRKYDFSISDIKLLLEHNDNILPVLEAHLNNTKQNAKEQSIVLTNLNNAYSKPISNLDELCQTLGENIKPTEFDLIQQTNALWQKAKLKLPKLLTVTGLVAFVSILFFVLILILLSKAFLSLA